MYVLQMSGIDPDPTLLLEEVALDAHPLVEHFYRDNGYKIKCGRQERLFVVRKNREIVAAARLLPKQQNTWWLRNMLVAKEKRNTGLGSFLMREILQQLKPDSCFCFALYQVVDFYQRHGFLSGMPEDCPPDITAEYRKYKSRGRDWVLMYTRNDAS